MGSTCTPYFASIAAQHRPPRPAPTTTTSVEWERASSTLVRALPFETCSLGAAVGAADTLAVAGHCRACLLHKTLTCSGFSSYALHMHSLAILESRMQAANNTCPVA